MQFESSTLIVDGLRLSRTSADNRETVILAWPCVYCEGLLCVVSLRPFCSVQTDK